MWISKKNFNKLQTKVDSLIDPLTTRGSSTDRTTRLVGSSRINDNQKNLNLYISNGFVQRVVDAPAEDATREWIEISATLDGIENQEIKKMVEERLKDLGIRGQIKDLIRYSRLYSKGSFLYYGVLAHQIQQNQILTNPLPAKIQSIEFINVIDDPDRVNIQNLNPNNPTLKNYNQMRFTISAQEIHPNRLSWLVNSLIPSMQTGLSVVQIIQDAIICQDSALWSMNSFLMAMAIKVFKSEDISNLNITQKGELLARMKHLMDTQSSMILNPEESIEMLNLTPTTGMKEIFEFIFENLSGLSGIPKNILLGKSHGIVSAGAYDTLNYFQNIAKFQENGIRPIIQKIIDLIIKEERGEIYQAISGDIKSLKVDFEFKPLYKLDPQLQADVDLKNSQRDQIEFNISKSSPQELRDLDPRYKGREPFTVYTNFSPNFTEPKTVESEELEVPVENEEKK